MTERIPVRLSLLDRLVDDESRRGANAGALHRSTEDRLRESVRRDLAWLFNSGAIEQTTDLAGFEEVRRSVLNYGMPNATGRALSDGAVHQLIEHMRQAILRFEPRIAPDSLKVTRAPSGEQGAGHAIGLKIEGQLRTHPVPLELMLRTDLDLESGVATVEASSRSS